MYAFGSGGNLSQEEARLLAVNRASTLQNELGVVSWPPLPLSEGSPKRNALVKEVSFPPSGMVTTTNPMAGGSLNTEPDAGRDGSWHWGKSVLPLDFRTMDFDDMEEATRGLYNMKDGWLYSDEVTPVLGSCEGGNSVSEQAVGEWWKEYSPKIADRLVPFVRNLTVQEKDKYATYKDSLFNVLDHLADGGSLIDKQLPLVALEEEKQRNVCRDGTENKVRVIGGSQTRDVDYNAQSVSFGPLHFLAIDMGEDVPLSLRMRQAIGSGNPREANQCVIKHMALGLDWFNNGRKLRIPTRNRVEIIASEIRAGEFPKHSFAWIK